MWKTICLYFWFIFWQVFINRILIIYDIYCMPDMILRHSQTLSHLVYSKTQFRYDRFRESLPGLSELITFSCSAMTFITTVIFVCLAYVFTVTLPTNSFPTPIRLCASDSKYYSALHTSVFTVARLVAHAKHSIHIYWMTEWIKNLMQMRALKPREAKKLRSQTGMVNGITHM